ncbi:ribonucleoside-diphosphate reductase [Streptacidiphilus sp. EB103A]|uniref:TSCPD domain-containing protein n=1 Tax=Streptacidiphilus sp. EB103A TaxID=3156275 RepID=UPI003517F00E
MVERSVSSPARAVDQAPVVPRPFRRPPRRLHSLTQSFNVGEGKGYLTVSCTDAGAPVEVMVRMAKQGSTLAGMMDAFSTTITRGLQHGVPLDVFVSEYVNMRFEPAGMTNDPEIRQVSSVMDYVGRRLAMDYLPYEVRAGLGVLTAEERKAKEALDGAGDVVWQHMIGLAMSAPPAVR